MIHIQIDDLNEVFINVSHFVIVTDFRIDRNTNVYPKVVDI